MGYMLSNGCDVYLQLYLCPGTMFYTILLLARAPIFLGRRNLSNTLLGLPSLSHSWEIFLLCLYFLVKTLQARFSLCLQSLPNPQASICCHASLLPLSRVGENLKKVHLQTCVTHRFQVDKGATALVPVMETFQRFISNVFTLYQRDFLISVSIKDTYLHAPTFSVHLFFLLFYISSCPAHQRLVCTPSVYQVLHLVLDLLHIPIVA